MPYIGNQPAPQNVGSDAITDGSIVNADINASAAIAISKLDGVTATNTELNYNDITTLGTVEASKVVTADANGDVTFPDGEILKLGTSGDLRLFHNGSASYITDQGTGNLVVQASDAFIVQNGAGTENLLTAYQDGSVTLYYDNTARLATNGGGANVTGDFISTRYRETYVAVTSSSNATTVDCNDGNSFSHTLTENTTFTFSNAPASGSSFTFSIEIIQDASASGFTVTWPSSVDWPSGAAPTLTATASAKDVFVFTTRDSGTTWYGFTAGLALA